MMTMPSLVHQKEGARQGHAESKGIQVSAKGVIFFSFFFFVPQGRRDRGRLFADKSDLFSPNEKSCKERRNAEGKERKNRRY